MTILQVTGQTASDIPLDPMLYVITILFILGVALLFIRIYPLLINLIYRLGKRIWGPVTYLSLNGIAKSGAINQFVMLLLACTVSIGLYNANTARTINANNENKTEYTTGADMVLHPQWNPVFTGSSSNSMTLLAPAPSDMYKSLKGVEVATPVYQTATNVKSANLNLQGIKLMAIKPDEFGKVAYMESDLLPTNINNYLNIMTKNPQAVFVSESFMKDNDLHAGDAITYGDYAQNLVHGVIYGAVNYWPTMNAQSGTVNNPAYFIISNYTYLEDNTKTVIDENTNTKLQYDVWVKLKPNATTTEVYNDITKKILPITTVDNLKQNMIAQKNDPTLQGTNSSLTMGFLVVIVICFIGFLIYWVLSIKKRSLQFGILRSMGMKSREIIGIIVLEQILISVVSIVAGIIIGGVASQLFIPLLQVVYSTQQQILPFVITYNRGDYIKLYAIVAVMILVSIGILARIIASLKVSQAIKLGED
jgi:putative ABC transport system permease protein